MTKKIYEVSMTTSLALSVEREILKSFLIGGGFRSDQIAELDDGKRVRMSVYFPLASKAKKVSRILSGLELKGVKISIKALGSEDWRDKWKDDFKPFKLSERFDIVPLWEKKTFKVKKRIPIYIDTCFAFGTGLHETTKFMVRLIERCSQRLDSFMDIGTGTGILSIIACKIGSKRIVAIDNDKDALKVARKNVLENSCDKNKILMKVGDLKSFSSEERFEFVSANLITDVLISFRKNIVSKVKSGGYLAVSGISLDSELGFRKKFFKRDIRCVKIEKGKKWMAFLFKKI